MDPEGDTVRRQTASRTNKEKKFLVIVAASQQGFHYLEVLPTIEHVTSDRYIDFLRNLEKKITSIFRENVRLQHDNSRPHSAEQTSQYLDEETFALYGSHPIRRI